MSIAKTSFTLKDFRNELTIKTLNPETMPLMTKFG